ncbi:PAS domain S-box protein [Thermodesulfobacteriota bacterium]
MKSIEELEKKINKIKEENRDYKKKITGLKKENSILEKDLRYINVIHNSIPAGIVLIWDKAILVANDTFLELTGHDREEVINRPYLDFIHPSSLIDVRNRHKKWNTEKVKRDQYDARFINKTGDPVICSVESKRVRYKGRSSYILNITRLEAREKDQEAKKRETRAETVKKLLEGFKKEKEKTASSIWEMIALIDKNVTSPDIQLKQLVSNLDSRAKSTLKHARMLNLIVDDTGHEDNKTRFNINTVIEDAVSSTLDSINEMENGIRINTYFRSSSLIEGNTDYFKEAFVHILLHLTKNLSKGGDIHITTEENTDFSFVYIQDNSTGKDQDSLDDLFYPYYKTNNLGLAYSRAVIKRHNGTLEAITGKGEGIIFQIILPLAPKVIKKKKIDKGRLKKSRILIIQDDDVARELMSHLLTDRGCRLDTSKSFLEGLAKIKKNKIDLVVTDTDSIEMDMNNFLKKCKILKPNMLTVCIGNRKGKIERNKDALITPDLFIPKPIEINRVVKKVSQLLMTER